MDAYPPHDDVHHNGLMDIDPSSEPPLHAAPPTPTASPPHLLKPDPIARMSVDSDDQAKVKFVHDSSHDHESAEREPVSAADYEAMKPLVLESLGDLEIIDETHLMWEIKNYSKLPAKNYSPEFSCGGWNWRILLFPWGNNQKECISAYLEVVPPSNPPPNWSVCAQFAIQMWNPTNPTKHRHTTAVHRFYENEADWGFTQFHSVRASYLKAAHTNDTTFTRGGGETNFTVYMRVVKDSTGVLWHNFREYDSRKQTGCVGLKNQGATCYMNSLLQSLYFTNAFRKIVFKIPTEHVDPVKSLSLALQRVFINLQTSREPVETTGLTKSFGWDSYESFVQHDAQEFERVLLEGLEKGMKEAGKTSTASFQQISPPPPDAAKPPQLQDQLKYLFCGKMESYIRCVNVNYESRRGEEFWDLQLNVKGNKDLRASFEEFVAVEMMEGDNQYRAEGFGLQDAEKGVRFLTFPPVLHMQLKRFEYDFNRDAIIKINDRYEFPLEIDLSDFLATSADRSVPCNYHLHGVLVHSGDVHGGHYFGMIKPSKDQKWYRYDDERVIPVTLSDVLEENFGGESSPTPTTMSTLSVSRLSRHAAQWKRFTSAYMLVYFRESALDEILAPITEADVPAHVVNTVHAEREEAMRVKREKDEEHLFINVRVVDIESFRHHEGVDLANFDASDREAAKWVHVFRIKKDLTWAAFYESLRKSFGIVEGHEIRVWNLVNRQNRTVRPDVPVPPDPNLSIEAWLVSVTTKGDIKLYLERSEDVWHPTVTNLPKRITPLSPPLPIPPPSYHDDSIKDTSPLLQFSHSSSRSNGDFDHQANGTGFDWPEVGKVQGVYNSRHDAVMILIFLKWFDVDGQRLLGKTPIYVHRQHKTGTLTPIIAEMMGWKSEVGESPVQISLFEEIKPGMIEPLKPNASYIACEIQDGDIICYMRGISSKRADELLREGKYPDPQRYYEFLHNKITLKFLPKYSDQTIKEEFQIVLSKAMKYDQVAAKVADHLKVQPTHLRFWPTTNDGRPRQYALKRNGPVNIISQMTAPGGMSLPPIVFYEVLELSLADMESRREITVNWLPDGANVLEPITLLVSRQATFDEIAQALVAKHTSIPPEVHDRIRLFEVRQHRDYREFQPTQNLSMAGLETSYGSHLYAEPIPLEEEEAGELDRAIVVLHFQKEFTRLHGVPIRFVVKPRELWYDTKKRLQKRLGSKEKDFAKIKAFFVTDPSHYPKLVPLEDEEILYDRVGDSKFTGPVLALDHPDRTPGRKAGFEAKALSIKS